MLAESQGLSQNFHPPPTTVSMIEVVDTMCRARMSKD
jgi:hypothetical protein